MPDLPKAFLDALKGLGLVPDGAAVVGAPLEGGVSSDIWHVTIGQRDVCVKRALARLKVAKDWRVPETRHASEARWLAEVARIAPGHVPAILGHDETAGIIVMEFLKPGDFPVWKSLLRRCEVSPETISQVAGVLVRIHANTARRPELESMYDNDLFHELRLAPYFLALIDAHPDMEAVLREIVASVGRNRKAMTHGDFSPKNILIGPDGPVVLDAECAGWSDPAFDLAFCLNHLLLKAVWTSSAAPALHEGFTGFVRSYLSGVDWEAPSALEIRAARLLSAMLLARIDGKSPVEYITTDADRDLVRSFARRLLAQPEDHLDTVAALWFDHLKKHQSGSAHGNA